MKRSSKFVRQCETRMIFPPLVVFGVVLTASVVLACASWSADRDFGAASAQSGWIGLPMPMVPLTVIFLLNLLP